jgi:hypothetical protein
MEKVGTAPTSERQPFGLVVEIFYFPRPRFLFLLRQKAGNKTQLLVV